MPRKYAVLHQFTVDLDRLLTEAEAAFSALRKSVSPNQQEILAVFRPTHSLKGICGMVEESKLLVRAFHRFEDALPPLLPVRPMKTPPKNDWIAAGEATFRMAREVERIIRMKLELWKKLGADESESRGLVVVFHSEGNSEKIWIPVTSLQGLASHAEGSAPQAVETIGDLEDSTEYLLVEASEGVVALNFNTIVSTCTRLEAVQGGVPYSFKEWWSTFQKRTARARARNAA